jgi:ABC-type multidrug transport system fused ATPase/permease subunit
LEKVVEEDVLQGSGTNSAPPEDAFQITHYSTGEILRRTWPLLRPHWKRGLLAILLITLVGMAVAIMPLFPKYVIDNAIPRRNLKLAVGIMAIFVGTQFLRMLCWYLAQRIILWLREEMTFHLRSQGFQHLQRLCMRFHNKFTPGFLYDRVFGGSINAVWTFIGLVLTNLTSYGSALVFSLGFCLYLSVPMTAVILFGSLGYILAGRYLSPSIHQKTLLYINDSNIITEYIVDKLRGTKTIQGLSLEDRVKSDFEDKVWPMQVKFLQAQLQIMKLHFLTEGLGYLLTAVVVVGGTALIFARRMEIGTLVAFLGYEAALIGMMQNLVGVFGQFSAARAGFDQLFTVLDTQSTVVDQPRIELPATITGRLEFRDVTFAYEDKPVLNKINLTVLPGQKVALVGRSGSGKTTLTNLLLRFYDPNEGQILLDGVDIRDFPLRKYRSLYGFVLQDPFLFNDTLAGNLRCARPEATEQELYEVLDKACALDFVNQFPDTIHHRMGDAGSQISGGQRQRIAIARCMLLRSRFVILDEATSALDSESEHRVQKGFEALFEGRTVFLIAHRLNTLRRMDRILVLDQGRIVEDGTFDELLAKEGLFSYLYHIALSSDTQAAKGREAGFA